MKKMKKVQKVQKEQQTFARSVLEATADGVHIAAALAEARATRHGRRKTKAKKKAGTAVNDDDDAELWTEAGITAMMGATVAGNSIAREESDDCLRSI